MHKKGRRKVMTQDDIDALNQTSACAPKANRPFFFDQPAAPREEVQKMIVLTVTNIYVRPEYLMPLAPANF